MSFIELFALAVALAMDAFAVSVCAGCTVKKVTLGHYLRPALTFGIFQFVMPVLGWTLGLTVRSFIENWDHWIAFLLLAWIGGNMLKSGLFPDKESTSSPDPTHGGQLFMLGVATSLDALAVGLSFSLLQMSIWGPATLIGIVCFIISALGVLAGKMLSRAAIIGKRANVLGGCVLIGIGIKILIEHGVLG